MFVNYKSKYNQQFERAERLEKKVAALEAVIKRHNDDVYAAARKDVATSPFTVDFESMNAFSVERMLDNTGASTKTVIGYFTTDRVASETGNTEKKTVHEWTFYCSHEEHERLVKEFNAWKGKKK